MLKLTDHTAYGFLLLDGLQIHKIDTAFCFLLLGGLCSCTCWWIEHLTVGWLKYMSLQRTVGSSSAVCKASSLS